MRVAISVHDVCDANIRETEFVLSALNRFPKTFLVIPYWENTTPSRRLVDLLENQDLALHGLTHRTAAIDPMGRMLLLSSRSLKEFYRLSHRETREHIIRARSLFEDAFGYSPAGFVPPMWYHNSYTMAVLKELNFVYSESTRGFIYLKQNCAISSLPVCLDFGNNTIVNRSNLFAWRLLRHWPQPLVRLSIHPADIRRGYWPYLENLIAWYERRGAEFVSNKTICETLCYPSLSAP